MRFWQSNNDKAKNSGKSVEKNGGNMAAEDLLDGYDEELGVGGAQERDWKGIATALFVIIMICLLILLALIIFTPHDWKTSLNNTELFNSDRKKYGLATSQSVPHSGEVPVYGGGNSMTASKALSPKRLTPSDFGALRFPFNDIEVNEKGQIITQTYEGIEIIENNTHRLFFERENLADLIPTRDEKWILVREKAENPGMNPENITYHAKFTNVESRLSFKIGMNKEGSTVQATQLNSNSASNDFAFVEKDKLYYQSSPESGNAIRVDQENDHLVQGLFDWVYTEEIFTHNVALWWSKNGKLLAFASYDNHLTRNVSLKSYHRLQGYPITTFLAYPKTFAKNLPKYTLSIWDKESEQVKHLDLQLKDSLDYHYIYAVKWLEYNGQQVLAAVFTNRFQNKVSITFCDFESSTCHLKFEYQYKPQRWAMHDDFEGMEIYKNRLYFILPHDIKGNAYQHIASIPLDTSSDVVPDFESLDEYDALKITSFNTRTGQIAFTSAAPSPRQMNTFVMKLGIGEKPICATCQIEKCRKTNAKVANDFKSAIVTCRGPGPSKIVTVDASDNWSNYVDTYRDEDYEKRLNESGMPLNIFGTVDLDEGYEALYRLSLPQSSRHERGKYPVLVYVYGGPNDQKAVEANHIGFEEMISVNQHVAILRIDGRGSGGRGWKYRSAIYGKLGSVEVVDQIAVIKKVLAEHSQLDSTRIAVSGWSYGGYMSLSMVEEAPENFFKCAISVAPVTNFAYYDATYTERYMGNVSIDCYNDVTKKLDNFKTTRLLLMHGLLDDNVHFQNSAILIDELQSKGIDFDLMVYPNEQHSISGKSPYVGMKMSTFIEKCFAV